MKVPALMKPDLAEVIAVSVDSPDTKTFTLKYVDPEKQKSFRFMPGKFLMVSVFGFGEMPISISSSPLETNSLQLTIVDVGNISHAMHLLGVGGKVGLRGPFGKGFPIPRFRKKDIVFVSGGCGLAPLKSVILAVVGKRSEFGNLILLHGCRAPQNLLFGKAIESWSKVKGFKTMLTVDKPDSGWNGNSGTVTSLFEKANVKPDNAVAVVVGPPIMIHFAIKELKERGFAGKQIFASLERLMHCGMGKCAHCNIGGKYVCIDGPVFNGEELSKLPLEEK